MPSPAARQDYHRYLVRTPEAKAWGVTVPAGGRQTSAPGASYPPPRHPADHFFLWKHGRVLAACQVVFITSGRGCFESKETGLVEIDAGTALIILPGVWHRYAPDPKTGWTEQWIELEGEVVDRLVKRNVLAPHRAVIRVSRALELERLITAVHTRLTHQLASGADPERAALGLQVLAIAVTAATEQMELRSLAPVIARAEQRLAESVDTPPDIPALARELGVAYSYFRREFKRHTGLAPYQYAQQLRLEKACRLIANSGETLEMIADRLGFASAYHLSAAFKKRYGQSPAHWRRDMARRSLNAHRGRT